MDYLVELLQWLPTVKINVGLGINISLLQLFLFPLVCKCIKMLMSLFMERMELGFGSKVLEEGDEPIHDTMYDDVKKGDKNYISNGKNTWYIPLEYEN